MVKKRFEKIVWPVTSSSDFLFFSKLKEAREISSILKIKYDQADRKVGEEYEESDGHSYQFTKRNYYNLREIGTSLQNGKPIK